MISSSSSGGRRVSGGSSIIRREHSSYREMGVVETYRLARDDSGAAAIVNATVGAQNSEIRRTVNLLSLVLPCCNCPSSARSWQMMR